MSQENVEIIRSWVEAWRKGGYIDLGDLSFLDSEVVYKDEILPDHAGESYHGHEGLRKAWARAIEPWEPIQNDLEWIRDAGDEVVSCHFGRQRGKESGIETEIRYAYLWRFREGKVVYCKSYLDPAEALEAARVEE